MNILVIQLCKTSDVVLSTHIPRELKKLFHDANVDFLTFGKNRPVIKNNPYINNILTINQNDNFFKLIGATLKVRSQKYNIILDLQNDRCSGYITYLSGAKKRITYNQGKSSFFYNYLPDKEVGMESHIKLSLLKPLVESFNMTDFDCKPIVIPSELTVARVRKMLKSYDISRSDFLVIMSPTHRQPTKRWKISHFIDTAKYLTENHSAKVLLTYEAGERDYITSHIHQMPKNVFLMPELAMNNFIALIGQAKLHIGNESAPHHLAVAQDIPTFLVIGSSNNGWVYESKKHSHTQLGLDCQPCENGKCKTSDDIPCMSNLTFDMIKENLDAFIKTNSISTG
ncbi:MAG: hypothetical protein C0603_12170 [Denitrovibrio sp.]|nr:MAG: hypothetical protein C0603_12170 [Denitrovibrio sp.]